MSRYSRKNLHLAQLEQNHLCFFKTNEAALPKVHSSEGQSRVVPIARDGNGKIVPGGTVVGDRSGDFVSNTSQQGTLPQSFKPAQRIGNIGVGAGGAATLLSSTLSLLAVPDIERDEQSLKMVREILIPQLKSGARIIQGPPSAASNYVSANTQSNTAADNTNWYYLVSGDGQVVGPLGGVNRDSRDTVEQLLSKEVGKEIKLEPMAVDISNLQQDPIALRSKLGYTSGDTFKVTDGKLAFASAGAIERDSSEKGFLDGALYGFAKFSGSTKVFEEQKNGFTGQPITKIKITPNLDLERRDGKTYITLETAEGIVGGILPEGAELFALPSGNKFGIKILQENGQYKMQTVENFLGIKQTRQPVTSARKTTAGTPQAKPSAGASSAEHTKYIKDTCPDLNLENLDNAISTLDTQVNDIDTKINELDTAFTGVKTSADELFEDHKSLHELFLRINALKGTNPGWADFLKNSGLTGNHLTNLTELLDSPSMFTTKQNNYTNALNGFNQKMTDLKAQSAALKAQMVEIKKLKDTNPDAALKKITDLCADLKDAEDRIDLFKDIRSKYSNFESWAKDPNTRKNFLKNLPGHLWKTFKGLVGLAIIINAIGMLGAGWNSFTNNRNGEPQQPYPQEEITPTPASTVSPSPTSTEPARF